ncbi:N-acetylneuraminate synthase family protein [Bradyrhizobium sp. HKCCYLS2038]|uniref:N-acetylneuraminate synthase family protein n=1 Tax=unclassified Bradyrhizobium TaxID=2631580 RepID=UPI003EBFCE32
MIIGKVDLGRRPLLIAEIGNNHEGDADLALRLADAAAEAGADAVKVQIIDPVRLVNRSEEQRIAQLTRYRLPREVFLEMKQRLHAKGCLFMASVFDCDSLESWAPDLDAIKIASGDLSFDPLLEVAARSGKPIILSTGMSSLAEIGHAIEVIARHEPDRLQLVQRLVPLHCVSLYPTPLEQANLRGMLTLKAEFGLPTGYSDHTLGIGAALVAAGLGAAAIEKHFTLDKNLSAFRDHALSAAPEEFAQLATICRAYERILGDGSRDGELADAATRDVARRGIVTRRAIAAGETITVADLDFVRPAKGFQPTELDRVVGKRTSKALGIHHVIVAGDLA